MDEVTKAKYRLLVAACLAASSQLGRDVSVPGANDDATAELEDDMLYEAAGAYYALANARKVAKTGYGN